MPFLAVARQGSPSTEEQHPREVHASARAAQSAGRRTSPRLTARVDASSQPPRGTRSQVQSLPQRPSLRRRLSKSQDLLNDDDESEFKLSSGDESEFELSSDDENAAPPRSSALLFSDSEEEVDC